MTTKTSTTHKQACAGGPFDKVRATVTKLGKDLRTGGRDLYGERRDLRAQRAARSATR
jgi:hypothetical protein